MPEENISQTYSVDQPKAETKEPANEVPKEQEQQQVVEESPDVRGSDEEGDGTAEDGTQEEVGPGGFEPDSTEAKAYLQGWRPKEQFDGDPDSWVDAKEFMARAPLIDRIKQESKTNKQLKKDYDAIKTHLDKVTNALKSDRVQELLRARDSAIEDGDKDKVAEVEKQIRSVDKQFAKEEPKPDENQVPPEFAEWIKENKWFEQDKKLAAYADAEFQEAREKNPDADMSELLNEVTKEVKKAFPDKFGIRQEKTAKVETENKRGSRSKKVTEADLTEEEKNVMKTFVRGGHMSKQDYLDQIAVTRLGGGVAKSTYGVQ